METTTERLHNRGQELELEPLIDLHINPILDDITSIGLPTQRIRMSTKGNTSRNQELQTPGSCRITTIPRNGHIYERYAQDKELFVDHIVGDNNIINFACNENQLLMGKRQNICRQGKWDDEWPTCHPLCSAEKLSSISFEPTCRFERGKVSCSEPARPGTIVKVVCKEGYESFQVEEQTITCGIDGQWYPEPSACTQICGKLITFYDKTVGRLGDWRIFIIQYTLGMCKDMDVIGHGHAFRH